MKTKITDVIKKEWYIIILILLPFIILPFIWNELPGQIPIHWNIRGQADGFAPKGWGAFVLPFTGIFLYILLLLIPYIDPKKRLDPNQKPLPAIRFFFAIFTTALFAITIVETFHSSTNMNFFVFLLVTLIFLVFGNYMATIKPNYFIGVRTPWTLEDPGIWKKTHKLTGKLWTTASLVLILLLFLLPTDLFFYFFIGIVIVISLYPVVYSYLLYRQM